MEDLGKLLRQLMRKIAADEGMLDGYDMRMFAARCKLGDTTFSNYVNGKRLPEPAILKRLVDYFGHAAEFYEIVGYVPVVDQETARMNADPAAKLMYEAYLHMDDEGKKEFIEKLTPDPTPQLS
jgi:hypothetical protein